jgi:hypothetical protein
MEFIPLVSLKFLAQLMVRDLETNLTQDITQSEVTQAVISLHLQGIL